MKKFVVFAMVAALVCTTSCSKKASDKSAGKAAKASVKVAMVTDSGDITDQSFNQTTYQACKDYAEANGLEFQYYKPAGDSTADRVASIDAAYQDGYNVIVLPGFLFGEAIVQVANDYSDAKFIGLDISEGDLGGAAVPANVFCAVYAEEIPGFFAGYAAVKEGYRHLGFLGGMAVPAVIRYGYGFVQGANKAAEELGVAGDVTVEYVYGGQFYGDQTITASMDGWYKNRGVEVVFACGGGIWTSACEAAAKVGGKVIGVDVDQTAQINGYGDGMHVTSAMKGLGATVNAALSAIQAGKWADYSGKVATLGLVSGTDLDVNYVGLPTDTWVLKNFSVDDYKKLVADVFAKKIAISNATDKAPAVSVKVNYYQNIK
ncbi:MAG: BMP family ABC transporter substrate-binding protein [Treponema sp.]|nr:BMP family ABC transporter substrate-binding protein [Treponema sp.]